jgi:hypothetical protein
MVKIRNKTRHDFLLRSGSPSQVTTPRQTMGQNAPSGEWDLRIWTYYKEYYPYMRQIHLPTRSMLRKVIPEGVLANSASITGFLYFQKPGGTSRPQPLIFQANLMDARSGQQYGTISIPFLREVQRGRVQVNWLAPFTSYSSSTRPASRYFPDQPIRDKCPRSGNRTCRNSWAA